MKISNSKFLTAAFAVFSVCFSAFGQAAKKGVAVENLDRTCEACKDFYRFANGNWMDKNPIPPAYSSWGSFSVINERNREVLRKILEDAAAKKSPAGSNAQKIGDFYAACMNEEKINSEGAKPIEAYFKEVERIKTKNDLIAHAARLHNMGIAALFGFNSTPDSKNSTQVIGGLGQGGLGLPDRDYYLKADEKSKETRAEYLKHIARMFTLLGANEAKAKTDAETVMKIETRLAEVSMDNVTLRDPDATYNKMTVEQLQKISPDVSWDAYFKHRGVNQLKDVDVAQPEFIKGVNHFLSEIPIDDWKTYYRWSILNTAANHLADKFDDANFDFYNRYLTGAKQQLPRWRQCVATTDAFLGEALGEEYVKVAFPPAAKAKLSEMIDNLTAVMERDLKTMEWMGDATRKQSLAKLVAIKRKIGYPDVRRDYSALKIESGSYFNNVAASGEFEIRRQLNKIGKPVDRNEWVMTPPTVNAYYSSSFNEIVFPAGILQPPFFDFNVDDAVNYGAIGAVIGHEISHGFDDSGRKFDAEGNLRDWWTVTDAKNYLERAGCVERQYSSFKVTDDLMVNGKLVLGEAIGDLSGLRLSYEAYKLSFKDRTKPPVIDNFTPEQRFFIGFGQAWAYNQSPQIERLITQSDPHPLPRFRVNGTVSNMPEFAEAFSCKVGDPMARSQNERCRVW